MKTQRLARLAALLERYPNEPDLPQFDLDGWSDSHFQRRGMFGIFRGPECHTSACAVGLACLSGEFVNDKLSYRMTPNSIEPIFEGAEGFDAVNKFFGITNKQFDHLFTAEAYDGPTCGPEAALAVAARIRKLIVPKVRSKKRTAKAIEKIKADALASINS
jgi:hypothetical protein